MQPHQDGKFLPLTAFTRAAAIASTSLMVPFAAYAHGPVVPVVSAQPATDSSASSADYPPATAITLAQTLPLTPQPVLAVQPAFSPSRSARPAQSSAAPNLLITRADDGSWQLSASVVAALSSSASASASPASANATPVSTPDRSGQAVLAQILQNTALSSQACAASECQPSRTASLEQSQARERGHSAITRAEVMMADVPDGSLAKAILSIVVAAGAIATATAIAKQQAHASQSDPLENHLPMQNAANPHASLTGAQQKAQQKTQQKIHERLTPANAPKRTLAELENDWINDLNDLLDTTARSVLEASADTDQPDAFSKEHRLLETSVSKAAVSFKAATAAPIETLTLELMANELAEWVEQVTTPDALHPSAGNAAGSTEPQPLRLPMEEVDRFAEQALLWILNETNPKTETIVTQAA